MLFVRVFMAVSISMGFFNLMFKEEEVDIILLKFVPICAFFYEWVEGNICMNFEDD